MIRLLKTSSFLAAALLIVGISGCGESGTPAPDVASDTFSDAVDDAGAQDTSAGADIIENEGVGEDATIADDSTVPDATDSSEPDATAISVVGTFMFDLVTTTAASINDFLTVQQTSERTVAVNECGKFGTVFTDRVVDGQGRFDNSLIFAEVTLESPPDMESMIPRATLLSINDTDEPVVIEAFLTYHDCQAVVIVRNDTGFTYTVVGGGAVIWSDVDPEIEYSDITALGPITGKDGRIHLAFRARTGASTLKWFDAEFDGTKFNVTSYTNPDTALEDPIGIAFDDNGLPVLAYTRAGTGQTQVWTAAHDGVSWATQQVQGVSVSESGISFAIGSYGREGIAWTEVVRNDDDVILSTSLKYTWRGTDDKFVTETVMLENDGYSGGAGNRLTGIRPILRFDNAGRPHILYSDMAMTSSGSTTSVHFGQLRYAWRKAGNWSTLTVWKQDPPDADASRYIDFKDFSTNRKGTGTGIAAVTIEKSWSEETTVRTVGVSVSSIQ